MANVTAVEVKNITGAPVKGSVLSKGLRACPEVWLHIWVKKEREMRC